MLQNINTKIKTEINEGKKFTKYMVICFGFLIAFLFLTGLVGGENSAKGLNITKTNQDNQKTVLESNKKVKTPDTIKSDTSIKNKTKEEQIAQVKEILNSVDAEILIEATK